MATSPARVHGGHALPRHPCRRQRVRQLVERGEPAEFGVNQVIPGWTEALQLMSVGDKWRIACPPTLAYGEQGAGDSIPPNTALVFEIHLLDIKRLESVNQSPTSTCRAFCAWARVPVSRWRLPWWTGAQSRRCW